MSNTNNKVNKFKEIKNELLSYITVTNLPNTSKMRIFELVNALETELYKII